MQSLTFLQQIVEDMDKVHIPIHVHGLKRLSVKTALYEVVSTLTLALIIEVEGEFSNVFAETINRSIDQLTLIRLM